MGYFGNYFFMLIFISFFNLVIFKGMYLIKYLFWNYLVWFGLIRFEFILDVEGVDLFCFNFFEFGLDIERVDLVYKIKNSGNLMCCLV